MRAFLSAAIVGLTLALVIATSAHAQTGVVDEAKDKFFEFGIVGVIAFLLGIAVVSLAALLWKQWQAQTAEIKTSNADHAREIRELNDEHADALSKANAALIEWATKLTDVQANSMAVMKSCNDAVTRNTETYATHSAQLARTVERLDQFARQPAGASR